VNPEWKALEIMGLLLCLEAVEIDFENLFRLYQEQWRVSGPVKLRQPAKDVYSSDAKVPMPAFPMGKER